MAEEQDEKTALILDAAEKRFVRYGFRRTSMDDIAREAGLSRPTLYLYFRNKEDIFLSLSRKLHEEALERARSALEGQGDFARRLTRAFEGWSVEFVAMIYGWPHAAEIVDASHRLGREISADAKARFQKLVADALRRASRKGEIDLSATGLSPARAAETLVLASKGLHGEGDDVDIYRGRLEALLKVFLAGWRPR
jgi:AcrR family transcriptional regulator